MDEEQLQGQTGVEVPVAGEQQEGQQQTETTATEPGAASSEVAAQGGEDNKDYGPIITAEIARREAKLQEKFESQYGATQKNLERVAKLYGFQDVDQYMSALDQYEHEQEIAAEAQRLGVDEQVVLEHLAPLREKLTQYEQEMQSVREEKELLRVEREIADLTKQYPDFGQYQDKVIQKAIETGYRLEDAYKLVTFEDKLANISKQTEADTIRKLQENANSTPGALGAEGAEHKTGFASLSKEDQRKMIAEVKAGRRTSL
ncbi:hypothetical protein [Paenibacillus sp. F4]|uniref:hypothetical protein n=1 Tax=Paenibacillus sp. F4 TaxID=357385 RepID=UPI000C9F3F84|nr:hypothetical protein [Paenibacillus sp. F4]PNQ82689.1 hypothetical protein C1T21_00710 [Paenibacillus sp. F4]